MLTASKYEITIQSPDQVESKTGPKNPDKEVQINPGSIHVHCSSKNYIRFVCVQNPDKEIRTKKYGVLIKSESLPDQSMFKQGWRFVCVQNPDKEIRTKKYGVWIGSSLDKVRINSGSSKD